MMPTNISGEALNVAVMPVRSPPSRVEGTKEDSDLPQRVWMRAKQTGREEHKAAVAVQDDLGPAHAREQAHV